MRGLGDVIGAVLQGRGSQGRVEGRMGVPGFVDNDLDAMGVCALDDGSQVVAHPVIGAACEQQRPGVRVFLDRGENALPGNRPVQAVAHPQRRGKVNGHGAAQNDAVVRGLVTAAVQQYLVARVQQTLQYHLVGRRRAVG